MTTEIKIRQTFDITVDNEDSDHFLFQNYYVDGFGGIAFAPFANTAAPFTRNMSVCASLPCAWFSAHCSTQVALVSLPVTKTACRNPTRRVAAESVPVVAADGANVAVTL